MRLLDRLTEDMKSAMKAGDKERLSTIRLLRGQIKDAEIDKQEELAEEEEIGILTNAAKKRRESVEAYKNGGRDDLAEKETRELEVIKEYMPEQLDASEVEKIVNQVISEVGAETIKDLGKVMSVVMAKVKGRADGKVINEIVRKKLSL